MLKEIRNHYGIPQSLFADYLGVTRSHLSMAEIGKRDLSPEITLSLLPLYLAIIQPGSKSKYKDEKSGKLWALQKEELKKLSNWKIKENEYKLPLLEKSLSKMKAEQARCTQILESIPSLLAEAKPKAKGLLNYIEQNARLLQNKTGENAQLKLKLQILHLQTEISYLKKTIK